MSAAMGLREWFRVFVPPVTEDEHRRLDRLDAEVTNRTADLDARAPEIDRVTGYIRVEAEIRNDVVRRLRRALGG